MSDLNHDNCKWQLLTVIVECSVGSKVLKIARKNRITGGTIMIGHGTYSSTGHFWDDDYEARKEMVLMIADPEIIEQAMTQIGDILKLDKPNHGIAFVLSVQDLLGSTRCRPAHQSNPMHQEGMRSDMEKAIFVIVDRGSAELVVEAAEASGSRGATIINARGAGVHETSRLFAMEIEPEKEIVLILAEADISESIMDAVNKAAQLDEPGKGILFAIDVQKSYGLR